MNLEFAMDRRLRDIVRYFSGEKIRDFHIPTTLDDYRAVYRAYLPTRTSRTRAHAGRSSLCGQPRVQLAGLASAAKVLRADHRYGVLIE
jgi:hypothetical protein